MKKVRSIIFASSLLVSVLFTSCNKQIATSSATSAYTWSVVSSADCGYALLADNLVATAAIGKSATFPVIIEEANECHGLYRIINPMKAFGSNNDKFDFNLIINATDPERVTIGKQPVGVDLGHGNIEIENTAAGHLRKGAPAIVIADAGLFGTLKDGEISFPDNNFNIWVDGKCDNAAPTGSIRIIFPHRVAEIETNIDKSDYSLGLEYLNRTGNRGAFLATAAR